LQLKEILHKVLNIASEQTKDFAQEFKQRIDELELKLDEISKK
jgi:predicted transcriptional regulator